MYPDGRSLSFSLTFSSRVCWGFLVLVGIGVRELNVVGVSVIVGVMVMVGVSVGTRVAVGVQVGGKTWVFEMLVVAAVGCAAIFSGVGVSVGEQAVASKKISMIKRHFGFMVFIRNGV